VIPREFLISHVWSLSLNFTALFMLSRMHHW
jgi:hypothetical protein